MAPLGSHGATCRNPSGRNANGTVPSDTALPTNTRTRAARPVPGSPVTTWQAVTNATNVSAPRNPTPIKAPAAPVRAPKTASSTSTLPQAASSAKATAAVKRHHTRSRRPRKNRPMLASTLGISRPSSNTNTDRPARSPAGSGATSRVRAGRCSAAAAASSAALTACCWAGPAAPAVTIVTGPPAAATSPPAADCDSTLPATAAADGAATTANPPGAACASPAASPAAKPAGAATATRTPCGAGA